MTKLQLRALAEDAVKKAPIQKIAPKGTSRKEAPAAAADDLEILDFLKRPAPTPEEREALNAKTRKELEGRASGATLKTPETKPAQPKGRLAAKGFPDSAVIKVLAKDNPKRGRGAKAFALYGKGTTVGAYAKALEAKKLGTRASAMADLRFDASPDRKGGPWIEVEGFKALAKAKAPAPATTERRKAKAAAKAKPAKAKAKGRKAA